jgi:L-lactate dehydrogenase
MKVAVIGAGAVGQACVISTVMRGCADEVLVVDRTRKRAEGMVTDLAYGAVLSPPVRLGVADYGDLAGVDLVMLTAGVNEKAGGATDRSDPEGRLKLLKKNAEIFREVVPQIARSAPDAVLLVVTDPPDALADVAREAEPNLKVLSTGTFLDSLRFRVHLARRLGVHPESIEAMVLGEHGTSSVFLWSSARVGGRSVTELLGTQEDVRSTVEKEVREANITIIEGTGASQIGIGMVCARIAEIMARDEKAVLPIGRYAEEYGVTLSLPAVLGRRGVERVITPEMSSEEQDKLRRSAQHIRDALEGIKK